MSRKRVLLLRDFLEDQRTSMEVYADNLFPSLRALGSADFEFEEYRPMLSAATRLLPERANLRMRAARYIDYPAQAGRRKADLYHVLDHGYAHLVQRLNPHQTIVTVHDIIPLLAGRGLMRGVKLKRRNWLAEWSARFYKKVAHIITVSESTKEDLIRYCDCAEKKISVVYNGIDSTYRPLQEKSVGQLRQELQLPIDGKLLLITGDAYYKNQVTSFRVMKQLWRKYGDWVALVRLGSVTNDWKHLRNSFSNIGRIIEIEYLPQQDMVKLYNAVDCLLFPSWYEGFGWPPVEAMACGTPVVASNAASLPEAVGKGGFLAVPDDVISLVEKVEYLLKDERLYLCEVERGLAHVAKFRWKKNAQRVLDVYHKVARTS